MLSKTINMRRKSNSEDDSRILFPTETHALNPTRNGNIQSSERIWKLSYMRCCQEQEGKKAHRQIEIDRLTHFWGIINNDSAQQL